MGLTSRITGQKLNIPAILRAPKERKPSKKKGAHKRRLLFLQYFIVVEFVRRTMISIFFYCVIPVNCITILDVWTLLLRGCQERPKTVIGSVLNVTRQGAVTWKQRWPWKPYQMGPNDQGGRLRNQ